MRQLLAVLSAMVALASAQLGFATSPVIDVGQHFLLPDTPNQAVAVSVTGGVEVQGLNLYAQVADGGPDLGGSIVGPTISSVDFGSGAIFDNNHDLFPPLALPQFWNQSLVTQSGTVTAQGVLVTIFIDTTGFFDGTYALMLGDIEVPDFGIFSTDFVGLDAVITNGWLTIVPEPAAGALLLAVGGLLLARRRRN